MYDCNKSDDNSKSKERVMLSLKDKDGNNMKDLVSLGINYGDKNKCTPSCPPDNKNICRCPNLGHFDVAG